MPLAFSPGLRAALGRILADQQARLPNQTSQARAAVRVFDSLFTEYSLTLDGLVLWREDEAPLTVTDDLFHINAVLVAAAENFDLPELAALVPAKPAGAADCPTCRGTRRMRGGIFCVTCGAMGWIAAPA